MLNLLWYVLIGIGVAFLALADDCILVKAHGYSVGDYIDWLADAYHLYPDNGRPISKSMNVFASLWGLMLWPLRFIDMHNGQDERIIEFIAYLNEKTEEEP